MRTFLLVLILLAETGASFTLYGRENPQSALNAPPLQELGNSAARADRLYAVDWLGEETNREIQKPTNTVLLGKLLSDEDIEVASRTALAVHSQANRAAFDAETATKFVSFLRAQLPKERIEDAFTSRSTEERSRLLVCRAMALNALYRCYPIISVAEYAGWQEVVLRDLVVRMALQRPEMGNATDPYTEFLLQEMDVPGPLLEATRFVTESLARVPIEKVAAVVQRLLVHPLFQEERPLNPLLMELLRRQRGILEKASSLEAQQVEDPAKWIITPLLRRLDTSSRSNP